MLINQALGQAAISVLCVSAALYAARCNRNATNVTVRVFVSIAKETAALGMHLLYYWTGAPVSYIVQGD
jgi:hypothetical protein